MEKEGIRSREIKYEVTLYDQFMIYVYVSCGAVEAN